MGVVPSFDGVKGTDIQLVSKRGFENTWRTLFSVEDHVEIISLRKSTIRFQVELLPQEKVCPRHLA